MIFLGLSVIGISSNVCGLVLPVDFYKLGSATNVALPVRSCQLCPWPVLPSPGSAAVNGTPSSV